MSDKKKDHEDQQPDVVDLSAYDVGEEAPDESTTTDDALAAELQKAKNDYLYLRADFDNYKKSAIKERSDMMKYGSERLITELLNILDTFDQALGMEITPENAASFRQGIEMLRTEFNNVLERQGVRPIDSKGQPFDPLLHEALSTEPTDKMKPGYITQEFKKAYKMHDKVIRPAQVVVAKEPDAPAANDGEEDSGLKKSE